MKKRHIALIILTPIIILLLNFSILAFNEDYYKKQYQKNNVYAEIPEQEAQQATDELINYLKEGGEITYFNEKEKQHLQDVRRIIKILMTTLYIAILAATIILSITFIQNKKQLGIALIAGGLLTILVLILLAALLMNFQTSFIKFHELAFTNNLWILDPETDKLIVLFPESFFYQITKDIVTRSLITAMLTIAAGLALTRVRNRHEKQPFSH
ncbi:MAG: TIGR01906 family membrane protein [archaeon]